MIDPQIDPTARQAAHWLVSQLYDEVAVDNPEVYQPQFTSWLTQFRIVAKGLYQNASSTTLNQFARKEARTYYNRLLVQKHHTLADRVWFSFMLSWALLMACDYFGPMKPKSLDKLFGPDDPDEYLTVESLHFGHFHNLMEAVDATLEGQGHLASSIDYVLFRDHPLVPLFSLN